MSTLDLDAEGLERYARQLVLDEVGSDGQQKLQNGEVVVVGAGGLGSPVIQYLTGAGVGGLTVVDDDVVERSNLQRQVIHREADIDRLKVESAAEFVQALNPDITVNPVAKRIQPGNVESIIQDHDIVVDATDSFQTRFLLNDACSLAELPLSHGAVFRFEGQVSTFTHATDGPCYRCLFPEAPPPGTIPNCATAGVLGVVPGVIGALQATETLKLLLELGDALADRMVIFDALGLEFESITVQARPDCPVCGDDGIDSLDRVDYSDTCTVPGD